MRTWLSGGDQGLTAPSANNDAYEGQNTFLEAPPEAIPDNLQSGSGRIPPLGGEAVLPSGAHFPVGDVA